MTKPLSPFEVSQLNKKFRKDRIPPEVVEVVNMMLIEEYEEGRVITLLQRDIMEKVETVLKIGRHEIYNKKFLDFEDVFRAVGWKVEYIKIAYNESGEPSFRFTKDKEFSRAQECQH